MLEFGFTLSVSGLDTLDMQEMTFRVEGLGLTLETFQALTRIVARLETLEMKLNSGVELHVSRLRA